MRSLTHFKIILFCILNLVLATSYSQKFYFGEEPVQWKNDSAISLPATCEKYSDHDVVILNDHTRFVFYAKSNEKLVRNITFKINNERGLAAIKSYKLPESFDLAHDAHLYQQGRLSKVTIPFLSEFKLVQFGARKFVKGRWSAVPFDYRYEGVRWIGSSGRFLDEDIPVFKFGNLAIGDIVEIAYELQFNSDYGSNLFYFNSTYPKLKCEYDFTYKVNTYLSEFSYLLAMYTSDSSTTRSVMPSSDGALLITDKITMRDLPGINYPTNSFEGRCLPHVFVDFNFYRIATGTYASHAGLAYEYGLKRAKNFEWLIIKDTTNYYTKIYDKQFAAIRKFVSTLPPIGSDSTHKVFFNALCDTLNCFKYYTDNQLYYDGSNFMNVSSGDHLLKRRLVNSSWKVCTDILNDNKIFYYVANVQDKRFGEHTVHYRAHYEYEAELIALPSKGSYIYFMPRYRGLKYHLNELPFYYEGSTAALMPRNFRDEMKNKDGEYFKFIKTHKGTFNENTRTENATVKISMDSLKAGFTIKESLSGQYSTVLRHLYLNEAIDSTLSPYYFKRCTEKPNVKNAKIKLSSSITEFPFRYTFNCSENMLLATKQTLDLHNWFSFVISKQSLPEVPTHDYYFDFDFTDSYNFMLDFDAPMEIANSAAFDNKITNTYFELESGIVKNSETNYLLKVRLSVKERKIPVDKMHLLTELITSLETLNNYSLAIVKK